MKTRIKNSINFFCFTLALSAVVIVGCNCSHFASKPYPLAGWLKYYGKLDQSIVTDYQDYIQKLPPKEKQYLGPKFFYENGTGEHAVQIETDINGKDCWFHILFYDKENKRIKVVKYFYGRYES